MPDLVFQTDMQTHEPPLSSWKWRYAVRYPVLAWQRRQRQLERMDHSRKTGVRKAIFHLLKYLHRRNSIRLGFSIPLHTFGPGLSIAHWGTIAVDSQARIGRNCRIHQGVTIGRSKDRSPVIGDNCFIGANASIIGGITLGNDVKIGAGAVVNRSFPDGAVLVGVPAENIAGGRTTRTRPEQAGAGRPQGSAGSGGRRAHVRPVR